MAVVNEAAVKPANRSEPTIMELGLVTVVLEGPLPERALDTVVVSWHTLCSNPESYIHNPEVTVPYVQDAPMVVHSSKGLTAGSFDLESVLVAAFGSTPDVAAFGSMPAFGSVNPVVGSTPPADGS